jgi:hypothetical protein
MAGRTNKHIYLRFGWKNYLGLPSVLYKKLWQTLAPNTSAVLSNLPPYDGFGNPSRAFRDLLTIAKRELTPVLPKHYHRKCSQLAQQSLLEFIDPPLQRVAYAE